MPYLTRSESLLARKPVSHNRFDGNTQAWIAFPVRFRNYGPLLLFVLLICPPGLGFIYLWEGYPLVLCGAQLFSAPLLVLIYRAGINSAKKNFTSLGDPGKIVYLPLKVNLIFYFIIGIPFVFIFPKNAMLLMCGYGAACLGFTMAYISGLTYIVRSGRSV